jgi:transcriptional regulator with XRE-family HTH domain
VFHNKLKGLIMENGTEITFSEPSMEGSRSKSAVRIHYEAQVEVIKKQLGNLEKIRENLGLSQRKICQLLMVDPSAWSRWNQKGENPPPHIYRALQWYMILQEKLPGLTPQYFVGKDPEVLHQSALQKIKAESARREEFAEAFSLQNLQLERRIGELSQQNLSIQKENRALEQEIFRLKARLKQAFLWTAGIGLVVSIGLFLYFRVPV